MLLGAFFQFFLAILETKATKYYPSIKSHVMTLPSIQPAMLASFLSHQTEAHMRIASTCR